MVATIDVKITREFLLRVWLARQLMELAARVMGCGFQWCVTEAVEEDGSDDSSVDLEIVDGTQVAQATPL